MAELRVTRADLTAFARMNKDGSEISLSDLDRQRTAVRDIEEVLFIDDGGEQYVLKSHQRETASDLGGNDKLDYLTSKEENTSIGEETRDGVLGSDLQHHNTTGGEGGDLTTDEANLQTKTVEGSENYDAQGSGDGASKPTSADDLGGHGLGGESYNPSPEEVARLEGQGDSNTDTADQQTTSGEAPEDVTLHDQQDGTAEEKPTAEQTGQEQAPQS